MKTTFGIKNFRVFDENGVDIELAPITILTGKNSAGKSSIVKAVTLLDSFLKQIKWAKNRVDELRIADYKIDFTTYPNSLLGGFDKVLHNNSHSECITLEYTIHSLMLSDDVRVELVFGMGEKDLIRNGYLQQYRIKTLEGKTIYSSTQKDGTWINLNLIKEQCKDFLLAEIAVHSYISRYSEYDIEHKYTKNEYEKIKSAQMDQLDTFTEQRREDTYKYIRNRYSSDMPIINDCGLTLENAKWYYENQTFFHIPIIEEYFGKMTREEIISNIEKVVNDAQLSKSEQNVIVLFINDFVSSNCDSIKEYLEEKESDYLGHVLPNKRLSSQTPELVGADQMSIANRDSILWRYSTLEPVFLGLPDEKKEDNEIQNSVVSFRGVFEALMLLNALVNKKELNRNYLADLFSDNLMFYNALCLYSSRFIEEVLFPEWSDSITYISTGRVEMERVYKLDGQDDFSKLLKGYLNAKYLFERNQNGNKGFTNKKYVPDSFMNTWIKKLELGNSISVEREPSGYGLYVKLHKTDSDEGVVLADEGYGITQLVSILLSIETVILSNDGLDINRYYGMSSLDRFDDTSFHYAQRTIAIEEPEIHLHPAFQSKLADMFASASEYNIHFIVETHSEYMIRKFQKFVAIKNLENKGIFASSKGVDRNIISIYYLYDADPNKRDGNPQIQKIALKENGIPAKPFGKGFFDEADNLSMDLFTLKMQDK